ncbi:MAG: C4-type zinc ribbon domain-containing protein [Porphyromonadaceae bacterium]|nr:C4-type zinc ribbon domain-containing protein [Porphyromonadaceae bacterium]
MAKKVADQQEKTIERKLIELRNLQDLYSEVDRIKTLRGELPLEVQDLEDEIEGMQTRLMNFEEEVKKYTQMMGAEKSKIQHAETLIEQYKGQLEQVKNNREYDNLSKEIDFQRLEIELSQKRIREFTIEVEERKERIKTLKANIEDRGIDLNMKRQDLEQIKTETRAEEESLRKRILGVEGQIEERLLKAFHRIREGARNGMAVVSVDRDACGGCFNKIPPQRQLDIKLHKKVLVCEYCGRIMVDPELGL